MSRYQDVPQQGYGDNAYGGSYGTPGAGGSYGNGGGGAGGYGNNGGGGGGYGGYSDEPSYAKDSYPMGSSNPYASQSPQGFNEQPKKSRKKLWIIIGVIVAIIVIVAAVVGGVLGSRSSNDSSSGSGSSADQSNGGGNGGGNNGGAPSGVTSVNSDALTATASNRYLAIATDSDWMLPVYPTGTNTAAYPAPTDSGSGDSWPSDPSPPSNSSIRSHPRLGAPQYKWDALNGGLIDSNPYFKFWSEYIIANASATIDDDVTPYEPDGGLGGSGVLDVAREIKVKVKIWAYAYKITNETRYANRVFRELNAASGNDPDVSFGDGEDRWNPAHFLDVGEFCAAFAIGYDWLYDFWNDEQRTLLRTAIVNLGLRLGVSALTNDAAAQSGGYAWWVGAPTHDIVNGNWNCVNNGGLTMAALAIMGDDTSGIAEQILSLTVPSAQANCFQGASGDGSWSETANYWYFGTTGAAEMVASLISAYGDDRGLSTTNPGFRATNDFHMAIQGMTSLFNYGDHGPNKYSATANSLLLWSTVFDDPRYALYQRDRYDAPEPWAMFWYDPAVHGTWWDDLPLDMYFPNQTDEWAAARSSWSDLDGTYWAMKSGELQGHQTHGDLDVGDFVVDAMGERWFGELGSSQYLAPGYFANENQDSQRWLYYRKRTEGQNTLLVNYENQNVNAQPSANFGSTGTRQGAAPSFTVEADDTAFFWTDMTSAYNNTGTMRRGIRFLNGRRQILIQDDISGIASGTNLQWRAHTNATVQADGTTATLTMPNGKSLQASILNAPSGVSFSTMAAETMPQDPPQPTSEYEIPNNDGVTVLVISTEQGGDFSLQVLLNPQWDGLSSSDYVTPPNVAIDQWSVTSHNG